MITPILESDRLILRPLSIDDADHIFKSWTYDEEVAKYMSWDAHKSVQETIEYLQREIKNIDNPNHFNWGLVLKETGQLIGSMAIMFKEHLGCYELGYLLMKKYWGLGLATEAGKLVLDFAVDTLNQRKFFCRHAVDNIGSQKVMTKLGFKYFKDSLFTSFSGSKSYESKDYYLFIE